MFWSCCYISYFSCLINSFLEASKFSSIRRFSLCMCFEILRNGFILHLCDVKPSNKIDNYEWQFQAGQKGQLFTSHFPSLTHSLNYSLTQKSSNPNDANVITWKLSAIGITVRRKVPLKSNLSWHCLMTVLLRCIIHELSPFYQITYAMQLSTVLSLCAEGNITL